MASSTSGVLVEELVRYITEQYLLANDTPVSSDIVGVEKVKSYLVNNKSILDH